MTVVETLFNTLQTLNYPVYLQGTFSGDNYPDNFITFIINSSDDRSHYNDDVNSWTWQTTVIFYSRIPENLDTVPEQIRAALKAARFIPQGKGFNIFSDDPNVTGWSIDFLYLEQ